MYAGLRRTVVARGLGHRRTATDGPPCPQIDPWQRPAPLPYSRQPQSYSTPPIDCHMLAGASGADSPTRGVGPHGLDGKGFGVVTRILRKVFQKS